MSPGPSKPERSWWLVGVTLLGCVLLAAGLGAARRLSYQARGSALSKELDQRLAEESGSGWKRPVLRGPVRSGNAAVLAQRRAQQIHVGNHFRLEAVIARGTPPTGTLARLVRSERPKLAGLRASTQRPVALLPDPIFGARAGLLVDSVAHLAAVRLLLVSALLEPAKECLAISADAVRLAQDQVPGGGVLRLATAAAETSSAVVTTLHCLRRATPLDLTDAGREFRLLVDQPSPIEKSLAAETLFSALVVQGHFRTRPLFPPLSHMTENADLRSAPALLAGWRYLLDLSSDFALRAPNDTAGLLAGAGQYDRGPPPFKSPRALGSTALTPHVIDQIRSVAKLRCLAAGIETLARHDGTFPKALRSTLLTDPFSGKDLAYIRTGAHQARLYSVGPNGVDDGGTTTSDDVTVDIQIGTTTSESTHADP